MASNNYWMKLWFDILRDPKMGMLPDRLWRRVIRTVFTRWATKG